jgi:hypothetical protein
MNHKLWNIVSTERDILHMQVLLEWIIFDFQRVNNGHIINIFFTGFLLINL